MPAPVMQQPHVVIVGGGFAGLNAARRLGRARIPVTLTDKRNFHLFQPLLYQVATGALAPGDIATPQRTVLRRYPGVRVLQTAAYDLDPQRKVVLHEHGELAYDILVVATGVKHNYFGHDEWAEHAPGLKTVEHALEIRSRIFNAFELAELEPDPRRQRELQTFVVVGGGPTGVELAGAIGELAHKTLVGEFRNIDPRSTHIELIEGAGDVLPMYPQRLRTAARRSLQELGVTVRTGTMVEHVAAGEVRFKRGDAGETLRAHTVLWAAGVRASAFGEALAQRTGVPMDQAGRFRVLADMSLPGHPEIFVAGDLSQPTDARGREMPGLAPAAVQEGRYVADVIARRARGKALRPFVYRDWGTMAVIGMHHAVGNIKGFKVARWAAWFIWALVHIMSLIEGGQRVRVAVVWSWRYFTRRIGDRLITGDPPNTRELQQLRPSAPQRQRAAGE